MGTHGGARPGAGRKRRRETDVAAAMDLVALSLMIGERARLWLSRPEHEPTAAELRSAVEARISALTAPS